MFDFLKPREMRQYIDAGNVFCPRRNADVEIDLCGGCHWMEKIDRNAKQPFVRCDPQAWPLEFLRSPSSP